MRRLLPYLLILLATSCGTNPKQDDKTPINDRPVKTEKPTELIAPQNPKLSDSKIQISDSSINQIALPFPEKNMLRELSELFGGCDVSKEIGTQDGPDFPLYSVKCNGREIVFFSMHDVDTLLLNDVYVKDSMIEDNFGLRVGDDISKIKEIRGLGKIGFDPYHFHMYYSFNDSKLYYELEGELSTPDVDDVSKVVITEDHIKDWKVKYIIWR